MHAGNSLEQPPVTLWGQATSGLGPQVVENFRPTGTNPSPPKSDGLLPCAYCQENVPMSEFAVERLNGSGKEGAVRVQRDMICKQCLVLQLSTMGLRLTQ